MKIQQKFFGLLLINWLIIGCLAWQPYENRPGLEKCQFRIASVNDVIYDMYEDYDKLTLILNIEINNPNQRVDMVLDRLKYTLFADGESILAKDAAPNFVILANQSSVHSMTFILSVREIGKENVNKFLKKQVNYQITGKAFFTTPLGDFSDPITIK